MLKPQDIVFEEQLNRAKEILHITSDKDFAELLGINAKTFSRNRRKFEFPELELRALANKRPDLPLEFDYIYTGIPAAAYQRSEREGGIAAFATAFLEPTTLSEEEKHLIRLFRILSGDGKDALLTCAEGMAYKKERSPYTNILDEVRQHHQQLEKALKVQAKNNMNIENAGQVINAGSVHSISNVMEIRHEGDKRK